jgi:hypothetical protein
MKFLLDTNILIPAEPTSIKHLESKTPTIAQLLRLIAAGDHTAYVHPASIAELQKDHDEERRGIRQILIQKYPVLQNPPATSEEVSRLVKPNQNQHDTTDNLLLTAVEVDAVDYLVTDDLGIHQKAKRINLQEQIVCSADAVNILEALFPSCPTPPPAVQSILAYELDNNDAIFNSFRVDYPDFDQWLKKCKKEHRQAWTIKTIDSDSLKGVCIVNKETQLEYKMPEPALKICSFKISESYRGGRLGELLLKPIFEYAKANNYASIFIETYDKQVELTNMLMNFGFEALECGSNKGEIVLCKRMQYQAHERQNLSSLEFHVKFGPQVANFDQANAFIIPITPKYHETLMPEVEAQMNLLPGSAASGNGIRKAYLCRASIRQMQCGDLVFFYRSTGGGNLSCYGIIEKTIASSNPVHIAQAVGTRTVYSFSEIESMCGTGEVLAILFRLVGQAYDHLSLKTLIQSGIIKSAPQSIEGLSHSSKTWLQNKFTMSR